MLRPRALAEVLSQANGGGVQRSLLLNQEGSLLAFSGYGDKDARVMAAIAANLWNTYERGGGGGLAAFHEERMSGLLIECTEGRIYMCLAADLLLCLVGSEHAPPGLLRKKAERLAACLHTPLKDIGAL